MGADPRNLLPSRADPDQRARRKEIEKNSTIGFKEPLVLAMIGVSLFWNIENQVRKHEERKDKKADQHEGRWDRRSMDDERRRDRRIDSHEYRHDRRSAAYPDREDRRALEYGDPTWRRRRYDDEEDAYYHGARHHEYQTPPPRRQLRLRDARSSRSASVGRSSIARSSYGDSVGDARRQITYQQNDGDMRNHAPQLPAAQDGVVFREAIPGYDYYEYQPPSGREESVPRYRVVEEYQKYSNEPRDDEEDGHDNDNGRHRHRSRGSDERYHRRERSVPRRRARRDSF